MSGKEDFTRHLYEIFETDYHTLATTSKEEIKAVLATGFIAEKLRILVGAPVLYRRRRVYDPGSRLIEYNLGYYQAEKFTYSIDIERK